MRPRYLEKSITSPGPIVWPACEVPPPRATTDTPASRAMPSAAWTSASVLGITTPTGSIW